MKKSILIIPIIVLLFLVNACTPLPTGGPVSVNTIYKVQNIKIGMFSNPNPTANKQFDSIGIDVNNDNVIDLLLVRNNAGAFNTTDIRLFTANNSKLAQDDSLGGLKIFSVSKNIDNNSSWVFDEVALMFGDPTRPIDLGSGDFSGSYITGIRIKNGSNYNYAWLKFDVNKLTKEVTVIESAYNTIANQAILAGKK